MAQFCRIFLTSFPALTLILSLASFKAKVAASRACDASAVKLICAGKVLKDEGTLAEAGVKPKEAGGFVVCMITAKVRQAGTEWISCPAFASNYSLLRFPTPGRRCVAACVCSLARACAPARACPCICPRIRSRTLRAGRGAAQSVRRRGLRGGRRDDQVDGLC